MGQARWTGPQHGVHCDRPTPHAGRHNLNSVKLSSRSKDKNTIVLPGTDVAGDLADISAGRGTWDGATQQYQVHGRTSGVEPTGTTFPVDGPGFVKLDRVQYEVLKNLIGNDGDIAATREALRRDSSVTRAMLDEGSLAPDYWFLVAADGSYGRVMTDPDSDDLTILYALEPIPGEPGLKVVPPPDWAKTW